MTDIVARAERGGRSFQSPYRDRLVRELGGTRTLCVGMQNPSVAEAEDETKNDPTILRLIGFTTRLAFGRLVVVNTYKRRATDPLDLYRWLYSMGFDGREQHRRSALDTAIAEAKAADMFIAAWGNGDGKDGWPKRFADGLVAAGIDLYAFGFTNIGAPKHPLARGRNRIPDDQMPILWRAANAPLSALRALGLADASWNARQPKIIEGS